MEGSKTSECSKLEDAVPGVVYVFQDVFTCGACSKQFVEIMDFLTHKTQHEFGETGLLKCELCKVLFSEPQEVLGHYKDHHMVVPWSLTEEPLPTSAHAMQEPRQDNRSADFKDGDLSVISDRTLQRSEICVVEGPTFSQSPVTAILPDGDLTLETSEEECHIDIMALPESASSFLIVPGPGEQPSHVAELLCSQRSSQHLEEEQLMCPHPVTQPEESALAANTIVHRENLGHTGTTDMILKPDNSSTSGKITNRVTTKRQKALLKNNGHNAIKHIAKSYRHNSAASFSSDFSFILQTEITNGCQFSYGRTWFQCLHCSTKTTSKAVMCRHMQERHQDMLALHEHLEVKEGDPNDKRKVMRMSTYEKICAQSISARRRTSNQKNPTDMPGVYLCDRCPKTFTRKTYLRRHIVTHGTERPHKCTECNKSFKSKTYLQMHMKVHAEKLFRCNQCDFSSHVNAAIHSHRQLHNQGSVLCDICGLAYSDRSTLNKHKRVHDLTRPYACTFNGCMWRFKSDMMCKAHIRAHTQQGKFKCASCGYAFRHKHHLQRHEKNMHGINKPRKQALLKLSIDNLTDIVPHESDLQLSAASPQAAPQLVVSTDGTDHLALEDLSSFNLAYHSLLQNQEVIANESHAVLLTQQ